MRKILLLLAIILLSALAGLFTTPAFAQSTQTWISGTGVDVNPCSRPAPCRTWAGAIAKTATGGEIDALDPGAFGAVTVTKAITLANEGVGEAGILAAGTNGVTVDCTDDPNCTVVLRGLQIDGGPIGSNSLAGVKFVAGGTLVIKNSSIRNFTGDEPNGYGVSFTPSGADSHHQEYHLKAQPGRNMPPGFFFKAVTMAERKSSVVSMDKAGSYHCGTKAMAALAEYASLRSSVSCP